MAGPTMSGTSPVGDDNIVWTSEDELETESYPVSSCVNPVQPVHAGGFNEASSSAGPSNTKLIDHFVLMGFSEKVVIKAVKENAGQDAEAILNAILTYSALENPQEVQESVDSEQSPEPPIDSEQCLRQSLDSAQCSSDYDDIFVDDMSDLDSCSDDEGITNFVVEEDSRLLYLVEMGYTTEEASIAIKRCGPEASIEELADIISAAQMAREADDLFPYETKPTQKQLYKGKHKKRRYDGYASSERNKQKRLSEDDELIRPPKPMVGYGVPGEFCPVVHRALPEAAMGPPFFYYENVALAPKGVWNTISQDQMYTDARTDDGLRQWYHRANDYIHKVLLEPGYILDEDSTREGERLRDDGRQYFDHKYKGHFKNLGNETSNFFMAMGDDPLNQRFGEDWKRLTKDLLFDAEGNLAYKPKLLNDIRRVILPSIIRNIGYVPIPRAEYSDDKIDLVIENLVLQGANLAPNVVEIASNNHFKFSPYESIPDQQHHIITLGFSQIQADLRDVIFQFRRKSGWPKLKDSGVADVLIGGRGISVKVTLETNNRRDSTFNVKDIDVDIDTLKFAIRDSHHDLLYKFVKTVATSTIRKAVEAGIHGALRTALEHVDDQVTEVRNNMNAAKRSDETNRRDELKNLYSRKRDNAKANKEKADEKTGTFKLVTDPHDSIVPDIDSKRTEQSYTKRAATIDQSIGRSNDWKSPIFSIVNSSKSHPAHTGKPLSSSGGHGVGHHGQQAPRGAYAQQPQQGYAQQPSHGHGQHPPQGYVQPTQDGAYGAHGQSPQTAYQSPQSHGTSGAPRY